MQEIRKELQLERELRLKTEESLRKIELKHLQTKRECEIYRVSLFVCLCVYCCMFE